MNLIQRLKNIWKLGGVELFPNGHYEKLPENGIPSSRMAEIIHMRNEEKIIKDLIEDK